MEHLVADMRELYELIYDGESYVDRVRSREKPHMDYRHLVRAAVLEYYNCEYKYISLAEARLFRIEKPADHSTIINSRNAVRWRLKRRYRHLYALLKQRLTRLHEYTKVEDTLPSRETINHYASQKPELNALLLAAIRDWDQVHQDLLDTLEGHFARKLAKKEINQNGTK